MNSTPFPTRPVDVAALTATEFSFNFELNDAPSLDDICRRFGNDSNRALVWLIRFRALKAWCARDGAVQWLNGARTPHICEVGASFELNDRWEFDADAFCVAVDMIGNLRSRRERR
jgi:hypothetical protein